MSNTIKTLLALVLGAVLAFFGYKTLIEPKDETAKMPDENLGNNTNTEPVTNNTEVKNTENTGAATAGKTKYKDGTYTQNVTYRTPEDPEKLGVTLTISNDVVKDASLSLGARDRTSIKFQNQFAAAYKASVVGKKVDEVKLDAVGGASLTTGGFNNALSLIKSESLNK